MQCPIGIPQHFPGDKNQIRLSGAHNVIGLRGIGNKSNCADGYTAISLNSFRKSRLVARSGRDLYSRDQAARRHINQIDLMVFQ